MSGCSRKLRLFVGIVVFLSALSAFPISRDPLSAKLPDLEVMPQAQWYWVGQRMALNGIPMSIKMFTYRGAGDEVGHFYRSLWKVKGHGKSREDKFGSRTILGYELDGFYYTVQFDEARGKVEGKIVVTPTPSSYPTSKKTLLPMPPRSNVISKVESFDAGRPEETVSVDSRFDVSYVVDFYKDQLISDGWQLFSVSGDLNNSAMLNFQRGGELLQLSAKALHQNNSQKTQFLLHWLK